MYICSVLMEARKPLTAALGLAPNHQLNKRCNTKYTSDPSKLFHSFRESNTGIKSDDALIGAQWWPRCVLLLWFWMMSLVTTFLNE